MNFKKDARIKVIHKKNEGVSKARNTGIDVASGKYIVFVDSDDYVEKNYLIHFDTDSFDFVISGRMLRNCNNEVEKVFKYEENDYAKITPELLSEVFERGMLNYCYAKRFNRKIIVENSIAFNEELKQVEDTVFVIEYILCCENLKIVEKSDYQYIRYGSDTLSSMRINEELMDTVEQANEIIYTKLYPVMGEEIEKIMQFRLGSLYNNFLDEIINSGEDVKYGIIKRMFEKKWFRKTLERVDEIYFREGKKFCNILKLKSPYLFWLFLKIVKMKNNRGITNGD